MYQRNIETRSRNHCCRGKPVITYSEFVCSLSYLACTARAPSYTAVCGLLGSPKFFHIFS